MLPSTCLRAGCGFGASPQVLRLGSCEAHGAAPATGPASASPVAGPGAGPPPPYLLLDGAHTPESAAALAACLRSVFPDNPVALVCVWGG